MNGTDGDGGRARKRYPIAVVANRTGLSKDVLRVWESRYGVVSPGRADNGRRLYSEDDVERLRALSLATASGWSIGQVAHLSPDELSELVEAAPVPARAAHEAPTIEPGTNTAAAAALVEVCLDAVERLDAVLLEAMLNRGLLEFSFGEFTERVMAVLIAEIGARWEGGRLEPSQEHLASAAIRTVLAQVIWTLHSEADAPVLVATTPAGQVHELGAMLAAATAASIGWRATYLGPDLPAQDIAASATKIGARVVALSIVLSNSRSQLMHELTALHDALGEGVQLIVGGRAASEYGELLSRLGARTIVDLAEFRSLLLEIGRNSD